MEYVDKAITWAKAHNPMAIIGIFIVVGVLANLLGLG
tara:strand:- start:153 stop:263 length:111 start_codon:yes stop_codon:yes gene_type:complete